MKHNELTLIGGELEGLRLPTKDEGKAAGEIFISEGALKLGVGAGQTVVNLIDNHLFPFSSITLTHAGASGRYGPTLQQMRTQYASQEWTQDPLFLNRIGSGIQVFTVPTTGEYTFTAIGGTRGNMTSGSSNCARRRMVVRATLQKGWKVYVVVGQIGGFAATSGTRTRASAGGGGTFVYCPDYSDQPILVAGGAGGMNNNSGYDDQYVAALDGQGGRYLNITGVATAATITIGRSAGTSSGNGGLRGGGGGFKGSFNHPANGEPLFADSVLNERSCIGGLPAVTATVPGGFGGGGGCEYVTNTLYANCGGGGGYTGGVSSGAGYNGGTNPVAAAGHGGNYCNSKATLVSSGTLATTVAAHGNCRIELVNPQT